MKRLADGTAHHSEEDVQTAPSRLAEQEQGTAGDVMADQEAEARPEAGPGCELHPSDLCLTIRPQPPQKVPLAGN